MWLLGSTTKAQMELLRFPLGGFASKAETRALAEEMGLKVAEKPDSQDICFVPDGRYADVVNKLRPQAVQAGEIVHLDGRVLGQHEGIIHFTIGQRKGLGIGGGRAGEAAPMDANNPLYVVALDAKERRVIVGPHEALAKTRVSLREVNWLGDEVSAALPVAVKLRSAQKPVAATLVMGEGATASVILDAPQFGVAPGQACVFYMGTRVMGGGFIIA